MKRTAKLTRSARSLKMEALEPRLLMTATPYNDTLLDAYDTLSSQAQTEVAGYLEAAVDQIGTNGVLSAFGQSVNLHELISNAALSEVPDADLDSDSTVTTEELVQYALSDVNQRVHDFIFDATADLTMDDLAAWLSDNGDLVLGPNATLDIEASATDANTLDWDATLQITGATPLNLGGLFDGLDELGLKASDKAAFNPLLGARLTFGGQYSIVVTQASASPLTYTSNTSNSWNDIGIDLEAKIDEASTETLDFGFVRLEEVADVPESVADAAGTEYPDWQSPGNPGDHDKPDILANVHADVAIGPGGSVTVGPLEEGLDIDLEVKVEGEIFGQLIDEVYDVQYTTGGTWDFGVLSDSLDKFRRVTSSQVLGQLQSLQQQLGALTRSPMLDGIDAAVVKEKIGQVVDYVKVIQDNLFNGANSLKNKEGEASFLTIQDLKALLENLGVLGSNGVTLDAQDRLLIDISFDGEFLDRTVDANLGDVLEASFLALQSNSSFRLEGDGALSFTLGIDLSAGESLLPEQRIGDLKGVSGLPDGTFEDAFSPTQSLVAASPIPVSGILTDALSFDLELQIGTGAPTLVRVSLLASETATNTTAQDLLDDLNGKLVASLQTAGLNSSLASFQLDLSGALRLTTSVYASLVGTQVTSPADMGVFSELGFGTKAGPVPMLFGSSLATLGTATFRIVVNGTESEINVGAPNANNPESIQGLVSRINEGFARKSVTKNWGIHALASSDGKLIFRSDAGRSLDEKSHDFSILDAEELGFAASAASSNVIQGQPLRPTGRIASDVVVQIDLGGSIGVHSFTISALAASGNTNMLNLFNMVQRGLEDTGTGTTGQFLSDLVRAELVGMNIVLAAKDPSQGTFSISGTNLAALGLSASTSTRHDLSIRFQDGSSASFDLRTLADGTAVTDDTTILEIAHAIEAKSALGATQRLDVEISGSGLVLTDLTASSGGVRSLVVSSRPGSQVARILGIQGAGEVERQARTQVTLSVPSSTTVTAGDYLVWEDAAYRIDDVLVSGSEKRVSILPLSRGLDVSVGQSLSVRIGSTDIAATVTLVDPAPDADSMVLRGATILGLDLADRFFVKDLEATSQIGVVVSDLEVQDAVVEGRKVSVLVVAAATAIAEDDMVDLGGNFYRVLKAESVTGGKELTIQHSAGVLPLAGGGTGSLTLADGTTTAAYTVKSVANASDAIVDSSRDVSLKVADSVVVARGQTLHIDGQSFRISSIVDDADAFKTIRFRTGGTPFTLSKGDSPEFWTGVVEPTAKPTGEILSVEGSRKVTLRVGADAYLEQRHAGDFLTIDSTRFLILKVELDKQLDGDGNPVKVDGKDVILEKYVQIEADYDNFAHDLGDTGVDLSAEGVQFAGIVGPLGVHLLGSGSIGRKATFSIDGEVTLKDVGDLVLGKEPGTADPFGDSGDFLDGILSPDGYTATVGSAQVKFLLGDRTDSNGDALDETLEFEVVAEGLSNQKTIGSVEITFDDDNKPDIDTQWDLQGLDPSIDAQAFIDDLKNLSVDGILDALDTVLDRISDFTGNDLFQEEIPGTGKTVQELLDIAQEVRNALTDLRGTAQNALQQVAARLEQKLGLPPGSIDVLLQSVPSTQPAPIAAPFAALQGVGDPVAAAATTQQMVRFTIDLSRKFSEKSSFSFQNGGGVQLGGGAELYTEGWADLVFDFGIVLPSAIGETPELRIFETTGLEVALDVAGDDLKFNLGLSGNGLMSNLLQVEGKDGERSYFALHGAFRVGLTEDVSLFSGDDASIGDILSVDADLNVGALLPVYLAGSRIGQVDIGTWNDTADTVSAFDGSDVALGSIPGIASLENIAFRTASGPDESATDIAQDALVVDISSLVDTLSNLGEFDFFQMLKMAVDGLDMALESLESETADGMDAGFDIPVLGAALEGGTDFLADLRQNLIAPFREFVHEADLLDAKSVAQWLAKELGPKSSGGIGLLKDWAGAKGGASREWGEYLSGSDLTKRKFAAAPSGAGEVAYVASQDGAEWAFTIGGTYALGDNFELDLGLPALGLQTQGGVSAGIEWVLNLGFGISQSKGFYLILPEGDELIIDANAAVLAGSTLNGKLGFLELQAGSTSATTDPVSAAASFGIDLDDKGASDEAGELGIGSLSNLSVDTTFTAEVHVEMPLIVGIISDVGDAPSFPNIQANFTFDWEFDESTDGFADGIVQAGFHGIEFDMGAYIGEVLGPIVERIQAIVEPVKPLVDFLTSPIPILSDITGEPVTMLDLAKLYDPDIKVDMIYAIRDLIDMVDLVNAAQGSAAISLGDYWFVGGSTTTTGPSGLDFLTGKKKATDSSAIQAIGGIDAAKVAAIKNSLSSGNFKSIQDSADRQKKPTGNAWAFPIIQDPSQIFGLLLGKEADLVTYDMAPLSFEFNWSQYFPIVGPIGARIGINLGADIDLAFGYDTAGIRRFIDSDYSNYLALVDGFYVSDLAMVDGVPKGSDIAEVSLHGGLTAAAELNLGIAKGGVGGGLTVEVDFNLNDPDRDGKVRLYEMWENVANEWENNTGVGKAKAPLAVFDIDGRIYAEFFAYVDTIFWSERWQITDPITIAEFEIPFTRASRLAHDDGKDVVVNVGPNSEGRLNGNLTDTSESITLRASGKDVFLTSRAFGAAKEQKFTVGDGGKLFLDAGAGNDSITITGNADFDIEILGGKGDDTVDLSGLTMGSGRQALVIGGAGADTLKGSKSSDILLGDEGRLKRARNAGGDELNALLSVDVRVDGQGTGADVIQGNGGDDLIFGSGGSDKIAAGDGNDAVFADGGRAERSSVSAAWTHERFDLESGGGNDEVAGDGGDDTLYGGTGDDRVDGGAGSDKVYGHRGNDTLFGGSGDDVIEAGDGVDVVFGDRIASQVTLGDLFPSNLLPSELASRVVRSVSVPGMASDSGSAGDDSILGGQGSDILFGDDAATGTTGGADTIKGGLDNDLISGDGGDDTVSGDTGEDVVQGGEGSDLVKGGEGNDILFGDNGFRGLSAGDVPVLDGQEKAFGINLATDFRVGSSAAATAGSADTIEAGIGSDYVDGQAGGDRVTVLFRGGNQNAVVNVRDSGDDAGVDTLRILGTLGADDILVRASVDGMGVAALLPEGEDAVADGYPAKTELERVNFWSQTEKVVVDAGMGDDRIALDSTISETVVQGGSGDDTIRVGQMFRSQRTGTDTDASETSPFIAEADSFGTLETSKGWLSHGVDNATTVQGGMGDDTITVLHNEATVSALGEEGDDTFQVQAFRTPEDEILLSAPLNIDGGSGNDSYALAGTEGDDKFFITKQGILTEGVSATVTGVESMAAEAGAGDDTFYVLGTNENATTVIHGGLGSDTVIQGGLAESVPLRALDLRGHSGLVSHEVQATGTNYAAVQADALQVNIIDDDTASGSGNAEAQVLFVGADGSIADPVLALAEGGTGSYVVRLSKAAVAATVLTVSAPPVSEEAFQGGDRGVQVSLDGTNWSDSVAITFAAGEAPSNRTIHVRAPLDVLKEGVVGAFLNHSVRTAAGAPGAQVRSLSLQVSDATTSVESGLLVSSTVVFVADGTVTDIDTGVPSSLALGQVYWRMGAALDIATALYASEGRWFVRGTSLGGVSGDLVVHTPADSLALEGQTSVDLAYAQSDDGASISVSLDGESLDRRGAAGATSEIQWFLDGRKLVFFNAETSRVSGAKGILVVTGGSPLLNTEVPAAVSPSSGVGPRVLVTPTSGSTDVVEGGLTDSYTVKLSEAPTGTVKVVVRPEATLYGLDASGNELEASQVTVSSASGVANADGSLTLTFDATNWNTAVVVVVTAVQDAVAEADDFSFVAARPETIDDLDGAVWSEGEGSSSDFSAQGPLMIRHGGTSSAAFESETNEYVDLRAALSLTGSVLSVGSAEIEAALAGAKLGSGHPTLAQLASGEWAVMFVGGVQEIETLFQVKTSTATASGATLDLGAVPTPVAGQALSWRLVRVNPSLFVEEASQVDRVFVNDRDATTARTGESLRRAGVAEKIDDLSTEFIDRLDTQRFSADHIAAAGLNWGDFEMAEINLGHGTDNLVVSSAQSRQDGFQAVTIVNTGEGADDIRVTSYLKEAPATIAAGTFVSQMREVTGARTVTATFSITLPASFDPTVLENVYVEVVDAKGGVQRRTVEAVTVSGGTATFQLDRLFTSATAGAQARLVLVARGTDGVLSINAQEGNDLIDADTASVTGPLVLFGGQGNDTITVRSGGYVFGDRGQVVYNDETTGAVVTLLGTGETVGTSGATELTDDTTPLTVSEHQTDGVRRSPALYRTVQDDLGGNDSIVIKGSGNVVFGGNGRDSILIDGGSNIVLGDGGRIVQIPLEQGVDLDWADGSPARLDVVETSSDDLGDKDIIRAGGDGNVIMGGQDDDSIVSGSGADIILGDGGRVQYAARLNDPTQARRVRIETKSDSIGGVDTIDAGDGDNVVFGGAMGDSIVSGSGRDMIVGDGGFLAYDQLERQERISNAGQVVGGADTIHAGIGENTVLGGLGDDSIVTGQIRGATDYRAASSNDKDVVLGDNGTRTLLGTDDPSVLKTSLMSFNFQGGASSGIAGNKFAGAGPYRSANWNNLAGPLTGIGPSTFGNDPKEIMLDSAGQRMQGLELSYGGKENHRTDSIELNGYTQENYDANAIDAGKPTAADGWLFAGGVRTSGNNDHLGNKLEVEMDGLSEYFASYTVVVYIDAPNNVSTLITNDTGESIRSIAVSQGSGSQGALVQGDTFYIDDSADPNNPAFHNFRGTYIQANQKNLADPRTAKGKWANYVVFENLTSDRFVVTIKDGIPNVNYNGRDLPSIAGIQILGNYHRQDTISSSGTELGGADRISTSGGDDIVIGGAGADAIATFGDIRQGEDDFDIVLGDDGKVVEMTRPQRPTAEAVFATSTGFASGLSVANVSFDDIVVTGNGNDVVIGGEGADRINTERHDDLAKTVFGSDATAPDALKSSNLEALQNWDTAGLRVLSVNFSYTGRDSSIIDADLNVTAGQVAGAVAAKNWNNLIVRDDLSVPLTINQTLKDSSGANVNGVSFGVRTRNVQSGQVSFAMGDHYYGHNEIDADSDNGRLFESYLWSQKQDQIEVDITGLSAVNNGGAYDVYVYIDGDDQRTAGDDYAFRVDGNGVQYFLNDWQGNTFNGEFRRVNVASAQAPNTGVTPDGRMVGNYVVFKNVTGSNFSLKIRNHWYNDQAPLSMPALAGLQIVAGSQQVRDNLAPNGDYDKDVVLGDNGKVRFNIDVPYGKWDDASIAQNKAVEVESIAASQSTALQGDVVVTGRNQDLVLGGNGADRIDTGVGGDTVLGDNGKLLLTDYAPIGSRTPTNLAILDNQLQDTSTYIGGMNFWSGNFQAGNLPGVVLAGSTGGADLIEAGADNDLVYGQEGNDLLIGNEGKDDILVGGAGTNTTRDQASAYANATAFQNDMAGILALLDDAGKTNLNGFVANDFGATTSLGALATGTGSGTGTGGDTGAGSSTVALASNVDLVLNFTAGQEIVLSASDWPGKGNAGWHPDIVLDLNANGVAMPGVQVTVDGSTMAMATVAAGSWYQRVSQIPDAPPNGQNYLIRLKALQAGSVKVRITNA